MKIIAFTFISLIILFFVIKFCFAMRGGKAILRIILHAALGFAVLALINLTSFLSGVHIPLNGWSAGITALFGVPAVCGQLLFQLLF